jgi:hypothetical protein
MTTELPKSKVTPHDPKDDKMAKFCEAVLHDSLAYNFLTHPDLYALVEGFMSGELLRHDWLTKTELLREQILAQHNDEHRNYSGAV